ncbi:hypothetical protein DAPPUDRAFT_116895 [Daphnia pulex]|uniref:Uncharacterized protein n=1 Tax=Daphnia pulex TaxID=6669 RepID=E9HQW6_DAPPU|nr:hypothetical protein DAPPUDRAFT_116895 [Daphnia pulex]|eukprot:EFX65849.1 hypothetical protein DAPPUDRAFT_116895 [Daphnia pulex]
MESDDEEETVDPRRKLPSKMQKKTTPNKSFKGGNSSRIPLPPTGLLPSKRSNLSSKATQQGNAAFSSGTSGSVLFRRFSGCIFKYHVYFQRSWSKNNRKQEQSKLALNKGVERAYSFVLTP